MNGVHAMIEPIDRTQRSTTSDDARRFMELTVATSTAVSDEMLLDTLRRNARVNTRQMRNGLVEVATAATVLGYVQRQHKTYIALRGDDPAWAEEIGRYPSESLAVEALRMRRA